MFPSYEASLSYGQKTNETSGLLKFVFFSKGRNQQVDHDAILNQFRKSVEKSNLILMNCVIRYGLCNF